MKKSIWY